METLKLVAEEIDPVGSKRTRLAAMVLYKNKPISIGVNQLKTDPFALEFSKNDDAIFIHAEASAIKQARKKLNKTKFRKSTLLVIRIKMDGSFGLAKPCCGCISCIKEHNIGTVVYSTEPEMGKVSYTIEEMKYR